MDTPTVMKLLAIGLYVAILLGIGFAVSRKFSDIGDYFASGKRLGFFNAAFSARATGESV
ncbi:MAG: Na+/proline symporter [Candidatus Paceibacteria bacterium]|jgi:Na+/proline symporter